MPHHDEPAPLINRGFCMSYPLLARVFLAGALEIMLVTAAASQTALPAANGGPGGAPSEFKPGLDDLMTMLIQRMRPAKAP